MKVFWPVLVGATLLASSTYAQSTHKASAKPSAGHAVSPKQAMASMVGKSFYTCRLAPADSYMAKANPSFADVTDLNDKPIPPGQERDYFHTGDRLKVLSANTDMQETARAGGFKSVEVTLRVENLDSQARASVTVPVMTFWFRSGSLLRGVTDNVWFSTFPVRDNGFPKIGWSTDDVYCRDGVPDQTNTDARGGDQLVFYGGKLFVYTSPTTDRVVNVQSSF